MKVKQKFIDTKMYTTSIKKKFLNVYLNILNCKFFKCFTSNFSLVLRLYLILLHCFFVIFFKENYQSVTWK